ncbi:MAG: OmpA family protein [Magnetococcales bacterium]|nr:OmpA family protein [Magnetococcales bacterium]
MKNINKVLLGIVSAVLLSAPAYAHMAESCGKNRLNHERGWCLGCFQDSDGDRISDWADHCPETSPLDTANYLGCGVDSDKDGVPDYRDDCQRTPLGVAVNERGCRLDTDRDGIVDSEDKCPDTGMGDRVESTGCTIKPSGVLSFATGSASLTQQSIQQLDNLVAVMKENLGMIVEIQGHTDWQGNRSYNVGLGRKRAHAVKNYLAKRGIRAERVVVTTFGDSRPRDYNATGGGSKVNRRVELFVIRNLSDVDGPTARDVDSIR